MNRIDRLVATLIHLQSKRVVKAEEIANRFDISIRTVYRDIRALEEAGVPIGAEAGLGYFIAEGYNLPPVIFSKQEAAALLTGEKMIEKMTDSSIAEPFAAAMKKIRSVLRGTEKDYLEKLDASITVYRHRSQPEGFPNHFVADIQDALAHQKVLEVEYFSFHNNKTAVRQIEPHGLCFYGGHWHLIGWCRLRNDFRDFRTDRIKSMHTTEELFKKSSHDALQQHFDNFMKPKNVERIVIRFDNEVVRFLGEQKYYFGFVEEVRHEDYTDVTFLCQVSEGIASWMLSFGSRATPLYPQKLKEIVKKHAADVYYHYHNRVEEPVAQ
jgi:predicted DNA-binding transcriptional regulator YafY